ncbi:HNH endonuclease [Actinopolymorpha rutila]|uniref:Putative low-complexity protein n=1 Tax=Actinopolymorpha rutila TaxID=446787 RepID=A0A852ZNF1_9ACTN|nr:HNH endonuclease signature motif containing protein [Actinopolymorpha rutila]NYH89986.1 putative low-complexity protein [Actinopolymorpha rutila]
MSDGGECFDGDLGDGSGGRRVLPAGFADLPGGPELAAAVASVDVRECNGWELEELIKAQRRLVCWVDAQCLAAVNELTYAEPGVRDEPAERTVTPDPMTPEVLEPLLGWTGYRAHQYVFLATTLPRLPRVQQALASGQLELNEVRTIVDRITDAKPDLWGAIEDAIFPKVLDLRGGLLRAKVEAEVLKADPEAAAKRHRTARTGRNPAMWPAVDGVADLAIRGLSADQAAEAYGYIDAIARAVKSTGDSRTLSQLRADVAAALLTGTAHITDCSTPRQADQTPGETEQDQTEQDKAAKDQAEQGETGQGNAESGAPKGQGETEQGHCDIHRFPDHDLHSADCDCADCAPAGTGNTTPHYTPCHCFTAHDTAAHDAAERTTAAEDAATGHPAAGQIPRQNRRPDESADPPPGGTTTPPEVTPPWSSSQPSWGGIRTRAKIQLNIPLTTLMGLSTQPGELGGFGPVITEVAERLVANNLTNPEARFSVGVTHPVTGRLLSLHPIPARFLRGLQAELVHARDQRCVWTTCRRPAATCHLDHNTEHARGGETSVDNIAPLCPRHHKAKTERDWKLQQTGPGEHRLTDPYGRHHRSGAPSLTDPVPPEPAPATTGTRTADDDLPPF